MAIGNAIERGSAVYVYDDDGRQIYSKQVGNHPGDGLQGFTSSTVSIKRGAFIYGYDKKGRQTSAKPSG